MHTLLSIVQQDGLTVGEIVRQIPHDGPAVVVYLLVAGFCFLIWLGSRKKAS